MAELEWKHTQQVEIVHQNADGRWYFWDECYLDEHGPFDTEQQAQEALNKYCREELGHPD